MPWDLLAMVANIDASGGDVACKLSLGENLYSGNGAAGAATQVYPRSDGVITAYFGISEDGALTNYRWHKTTDPNWAGGSVFLVGQTEISSSGWHQMIARCSYPVLKGDVLEAVMTNGAAKLDGPCFIIGYGGKPKVSPEPFGDIPEGAVWYEVTTAHTATADTWTAGNATFPELNLKRDKRYKIYGAVFSGATLEAYRFIAKTGDWAGYRPGFIGGDTDLLNAPVFFSEPPVFEGITGLQIDTLCSAGDTAGYGALLIQEI